jgi:hypothetical protein
MDRDILAVHTELIEAIGWLCRDTATWTAGESRVVPIFASLGT